MYERIFSLIVLFVLGTSISGQKTQRLTEGEGSDIGTSDIESALVAEINSARSDPADYSKKIAERKKRVKGRILKLTGRPTFLMIEGIPAIDEAFAEMKQTKPGGQLSISPELTKVARDQLSDLTENPNLGHYGKDGSDLTKRISRYGRAEFASENITHWDLTPEQIVLTMLIDDGVAGRSHRTNVLNPRFSLIGAACGKGKEMRFICVMVFADKVGSAAKRARSY